LQGDKAVRCREIVECDNLNRQNATCPRMGKDDQQGNEGLRSLMRMINRSEKIILRGQNEQSKIVQRDI